MNRQSSTGALTPASRSSALQRLRELLLLERRQARSAALTVAQRTQVLQYAGAARQRLAAARVLLDGGKPSDALIVLWQGIALLARAYLASLEIESDGSDLAAPELLGRLREQLEREGCPVSKVLSRNLPFATDTAEQNDALPRGEAARRAEDLEELSRHLEGLIETRSPRQIKAQSRWRLAILAVTILAVPVALKIWSRVPTNVAANKSVTASSSAEATSPQGVVDERLYGPFGFHSQLENAPWVTIDLGKRYFVTDAEVYGRHDCCFDLSIPLNFQISEDGKTFRTVARKAEPFHMLDSWSIERISRPARYVRVIAEGTRPLVLSEIVVYGRSP
jgi:hypothetical protein